MRRIEVRDATVRFRMSYDRTATLRDALVDAARRLVTRKPPDHFTALSGATLTIDDGEVVGVLGPNGCGKTTLLRVISGIYEPDEGTVRCEGRVSTLLSLGTGFDSRLSGLDNIRLGGLTMGMAPEEIDERLSEIVAFADVGEHIAVPIKYYSSGMLSRLSFAIVVAMRPEIMLIDEIFSVGDLAFQHKSQRAMSELLAGARCQVIVSHDLELIRTRCTRAIYMHGGRIVMDGPPRETVARYVADQGPRLSVG